MDGFSKYIIVINNCHVTRADGGVCVHTGHRSNCLQRSNAAGATVLGLIFLGMISANLSAASLADSLRHPALSSPSIADTLWRDVEESAADAVLFFSAPARFSLRQWGVAGWTFIGTGMTAVADDGIRPLFARRGGTIPAVARGIGDIYGTWIPAAAISSGLYLSGLAFDEPGIRRAGRHVVQSVVYAAAITTLTKVLLGRHRPGLEDGPYTFEGPTTKDDYHSFPSGHSTIAFAVSSTLAAEIDDPWASVGLYTLAGATALSRLYADRHWGSDIIFGAVVGTVCGYGVVHLHDASPAEAGWMIVPSVNGIAAIWRF